MPKRVNPRQANIVNDNMDMIAMVYDVIVMIFEVNLVGSKKSSWWVDTGETRHVCVDKSMFHSFRAVDNGESNVHGRHSQLLISWAKEMLNRYTSNPSDPHWKAMTRVLHYLRYNRDYRLHYDRYPTVIEGYSDANWISNIKDSRSTSGYVFTLGGADISWKSSEQTVIAKSTMESEFIALA
ncbi:hypothetical protein Tco_0226310 [Tanacetum coccineum]